MPAKRRPTAPYGQYRDDVGNTFGGHGHRSHDGRDAGRSRGRRRENEKRKGRVDEMREDELFEDYDGPPIRGRR